MVESEHSDYCEICKDFHEFECPDDLFESLVHHNLVIFAGAGVSTEGKNVFPYTLYEEIYGLMNYSEKKEISFSELMSDYCKKTGSKKELVKRIKGRLEYIASFSELYLSATRFHEKLATIPCITEIVTTNWDDYFERECHATPFAYEQDMVFWNEAKRKVLKLHGSINNLGSIIATKEDYMKCYESLNNGLIGSQLKLLLANKRLVFIGYSFSDEDFNQIYSFLQGQIGEYIRKPYVVTLDKQNDRKWRELGLEPIYTAGEYFLEVLIHKLREEGCMLEESNILRMQNELNAILKSHLLLSEEIDMKMHPEVIYCLCYQDGVIHAFKHFLTHIKYGTSLCKAKYPGFINGYEELLKQKRKARKYQDIAYIMGYMNGYVFALMDEDEDKEYIEEFPHYIDLNLDCEMRTLEDYKESLEKSDGRKKTISNYARKVVEKKVPESGLVLQHSPFLL